MFLETMFPAGDGTKLYLRKEFPTSYKAVVVLVHGLCEHCSRYDYFTARLNAAGYGVYRFDHRGHGRSEGKKVYYESYEVLRDDVKAVVDLAKSENPSCPVYLFGHSMGGFAVTLYGTRYPGTVNGILLTGALTRYNTACAGPLPIDAPADTYVPNALGSGVCSDPAVVEAYGADPLVEKNISVGLLNCCWNGIQWLKENASAFTDPVLIMHGCRDGLVSEMDSRQLFGEIASEDKSLRIYSGLYHEILNEPSRDMVVRDILDWLNQRINQIK